MAFPYKNPISPIQLLGPQSVDRSVVFGTHFSTNGTGGYMEVFSLSGLTYEIPVGQTGSIEYSGNTIPINFVKGSGAVYSPDVLILNSDNISSGRRKLGMLAYVYEEDQVYQYDIPNYEQLWTAATASTNCVVISDFGTTVRNNTTEGQAFINAWTASTIEGVNGVVRANARWKKYWGNNLSLTGGSYNGLTATLTLVNITGGTVDITGFGPGGGGGQFTGGTFTQSNLEINLTSTAGTLTITGVTGLYISGGSYSSGNTTLSLFNSTGGTLTITGFSQTFSGGSSNCINQLYLNEIYPCTSDIKIQPLSAGKVYFGTSNGASGFTVDLVTDTSYEATRLGLNTNSPQYTFDFYARDKKNRLYFRDNLTGSLSDIKNIIFSGDSDTNSSFGVIGPDGNNDQGAHGISIGILGYNAASSILNNGAGKAGDAYISVFADSNGLNILNGPGSVGANTEDFIRFYAGQIVNNNTPDIHIQGSGTTRGFVGINTTGVTNQLHVFASTHPVRFEGLQSSANTRYLVADSDGVVTYTTASPGGGGNTITGGTFTQNNLQLQLTSSSSTVTISGVTGLYISGGSYSSGNTTLTLSNSTGGTLTITGFSQTFSGGSGNCINQLYLNEIYPCTSDIKIQPLSAGKVFFGSLSGASGLTVDLVSDTVYTTTRLGLNNSLPDYTFDFYSRDRKNRFYLSDDSTYVYVVGNDPAYGIGALARLLVTPASYINSSLIGKQFTIYNKSGQSDTRIVSGVIFNSPPGSGTTRINFTPGLWTEEYSQNSEAFFVISTNEGAGDSGQKNIVFSGDSDTNSSYSVIGPNKDGYPGLHGINIGIRGYNTSGTVLNNKVGVTGDSFIQVFPGTNGLNIIKEVGSGDTQDYIRFYAGRNFINNTPDIHIQGEGSTRGFVGINTTGVTNQLHVSATTNPLRLEGLQSSANTRYLVADSNGVVTYTTASPGGGGFSAVSINNVTQFDSSSSQLINFSGINISITSAATNTLVFSAGSSTSATGNYLPLSGGTVTGATIFQSGLTANTISATTYYGLPYSGTNNYVVKWTNTTGLTDSLIYDSGTFVVVCGTTQTVANSQLSVNGPIAANAVQLYGYTSNISLMVEDYSAWVPPSSNNIAIGNSGNLSTVTGQDNIAIGQATLKSVNAADYNIGIGKESLNSIIDGTKNISIGAETLSTTTDISNNIGLGYRAGRFLDGGSNILVGNNAGASLTGTGHIYIGEDAAAGATIDGAYGPSVAIGYQAMSGGTTGGGNVAIGYQSLKNDSYKRNVAIGYQAMSDSLSSEQNVAIGYLAAKNLQSTIEGVFIGHNAFVNGSGTYNVVVGSNAAPNFSGVSSVVIGKDAFGNKTTGNGNVAIGYGAGKESTGGGSVFIGYQAGYYSTGDNKLYIHNSSGVPPLIYGEFDNLRLGIATTAVTNTLHVSAATHPLRLEGLVSSANTRYLVANSDGVITYTTSAPGGGSGFSAASINNVTQFNSSTSSNLNFSGINITITSAATNTLVFSAGTGGGGGVTSVTATSGLSGSATTGAVTLINTQVQGITGVTAGTGISASTSNNVVTLRATGTTSFGVTVDGSGGVITTGQKGYVRIPYDFTITSWSLIGSPSGSITFDIWKRAGAIPTVANTIITGGTKPSLASTTLNISTNTTGWNITGATGDIIGWNVDSATTTSFATLQIFVTRTS